MDMDRGETSYLATATSNILGRGDQGSPPAATFENGWEDSIMAGSIFLSHSGCQKTFVIELYRALLRARYRPFFDLDTKVSLPSGLDYPPLIFQACRACRVAIIVLSEDYVTSLWPMLELQHLLHPASSATHIYPLFYGLKPGDLAHPTNMARRKELWDLKATEWQGRMGQLQEFMSSTGCGIEINLDMSSWPKNLEKLQYKSGEVLQGKISHVNMQTLHQHTEGICIQEVVSNLRVVFPPPPYPLEMGIEGGKRLHEEIAKIFEEEESLGVDGVSAIGVHGIGGSGKSTLCKMMATFYRKDFDDKCYYLEFPSNINEVEKLLHDIKANVLPMLTLPSASIADVANIAQAMDLLEEGLQRSKIFLAMDNVWGHSFDYAEKTMRMKFMRGSKILVTSRKKKVLRDLLQSRLQVLGNNASVKRECSIIVQVPSLNEVEAVKVLKFYSSSFSPHLISDEDEWRKLARSCFFGATQCHPLYLKLKGVEIKTKGRDWFSDEQWKDLFSSLRSADRHPPNSRISGGTGIEEEVDRAVEKSFNELRLDLQNIFIDLATAWDLLNRLINLEQGINLWDVLCYFTDTDSTTVDMFHKVLELEYHGLLEVKIVDNLYGLGDVETIEIHDMHRMFANFRVSNDSSGRHANALIHHVLNIKGANLSKISSLEVASKKYVPGQIFSLREWEILLGKLPRHVPAQTRVLRLSGGSMSAISSRSIKLNEGGLMNLKALRVLELSDTECIRKIDGWEGIPNLMRLHLSDLSDLRRIGALGCLKKLETLWIADCENLEVPVLVGGNRAHNWKKKSSLVQVGDSLPKLQVLCFKGNKHLVEVGSTFSDTFPDLKKLIFRSCERLERLPNLDKLGSLRTLILADCYNLKCISAEEGICSLPASLQNLDLRNCKKLERLPDLSTLLDLRRLDTWGCWSLLDQSTRLNLRISACKHLEWLSLRHKANNDIHIDDDGSSAGTITVYSLLADAVLCDKNDLFHNPFTNLRHCCLKLESVVDSNIFCSTSSKAEISTSRTMMWHLDVSGLPRLENLTLSSAKWVQKVSVSLNLRSLDIFDFPNLEEISCQLGEESIPAILPAVSSLQWLYLWSCGALKDVSSFAALTSSLTFLCIMNCPALEDVSGLAALTSLTYLWLHGCTSLREIPLLTHLTSLTCLQISDPGPWWTLSEEAVRQMVSDGVELLYQSPTSRSGLRKSPASRSVGLRPSMRSFWRRITRMHS